MLKYIISVLLSFLLMGIAKPQQKVWVKGTILAKRDKSPIVGATIKEQRRNNQAASSIGGKFSIQVSDDTDSLVFSYVGYKTAIVATKQLLTQQIILLAQQENYLEEATVNTGYQVLKPNEITGAVDVVSNKTLNEQTGTNILQRLRNVVPAFRYDNNPVKNTDLNKLNISIRGLSTINGNLDPLIVLDGFIYEGDMANIDPNSIEQVSILKDAAASAIWGARAGNGVIVITSKKGRINESARISFNSTFMLQERSAYTNLYRVDNGTFMDIEKMLYDKGYYNFNINTLKYVAMTPFVDLLDRRAKGLISIADSTKWDNFYRTQNGAQNYMDNFVSDAVTQQYALNISGGGLSNSYNFGLGYTRAGTELAAKTRKLNLQLNNSFRPTEKLQIDLSVLFTDQLLRSGKPAFNSFVNSNKAVPYLSFFGPEGEQIPFEREYRKLYLDNNYSNGFLDWNYYPLSDHTNSQTSNKLRELYSNLALNYKLTSYLSASFSGQYQQQQVLVAGSDNSDSYIARRTVNQYMQVDKNTGAVKYNVPKGGILRTNNGTGSSYTLRGQLNLNKSWPEHRVIGVIGAEMRERLYKENSQTAYGYTEDPLLTVPVDYVNTYPINPTSINMNVVGAPSFLKQVNRFVSQYANLSYIWHDKYGVSGSFRKDGANVFGATTNDKWSPLWSMGLFWELGKEKFLERNFIDHLKLRATYGYSGNVDLRKTKDPVGSVSVDRNSNLPIIMITSLNDPSLRWEKIGTLNIGLDYAFFNRRISGSIDWYNKNGRDLYGLSNYDYTSWGYQSTITKNIAAMNGRGLDLSLNTVNLDGAIQWKSRLTLSFNKNKTTKYYSTTPNTLNTFISNGYGITPMEGFPLNGLSAYKWMGVDGKGQGLGLLDGEPSANYSAIRASIAKNPLHSESMAFIGSSKPQVFGNLANTFAWRSFDLSVNISYAGDYYFRKPVTSYTTLFSTGTAYPDFERRWQKQGDELTTAVPALFYPVISSADSFYASADINVVKADHIRLEYINFSWRNSLKINNRAVQLQIYGNVSNLGILWRANKERIDPEFPYRIAPTRNYALGLKLDY
ncbi:TonB-linked SusC/RagA family outer membrane protein [Sphingobacterium zeae]|uniref:TonB-linked SusC/RagA family outer membrane protein n=2 Tax=Sphingobacterium zeae TaxID=1776859 RepID=A0ABU0UBY7_9SPHI|nr:TonB-linked SusC/RagA family outer membrane protein [Sphingobacterium zeae]